MHTLPIVNNATDQFDQAKEEEAQHDSYLADLIQHSTEEDDAPADVKDKKEGNDAV